MSPLYSLLSGRRVLLVEDEMIVAWLLKDMLTDLGCCVVGPAARVGEALAIVGVEPLDAAILDLNLNGELSYPVADALMSRGVPFLFSTGYDRDRIAEGYRGFPLLQKPYHQSSLGSALAALLGCGASDAIGPAWLLPAA
jgi:CheY-like chemotaxis protein